MWPGGICDKLATQQSETFDSHVVKMTNQEESVNLSQLTYFVSQMTCATHKEV